LTFTRSQIAELRGCQPAYVSRTNLPKEPDGNYSIKNPVVYEWVWQPHKEEAIKQYRREEKHGSSGATDEELDDLNEEKLKQDIEYRKKQSRKLDFQHAIDKKEVVPIELAASYIGAFSIGIDTNFLTIGKRISVNDKALQNKIDKAISLAIRKTKEGARKALAKESELIKQAISGEESEPI